VPGLCDLVWPAVAGRVMFRRFPIAMILRDSLAFCGWLLLTAQYVGAAEGNGKERFQVLAHAGHRAAVTAVALVEKEGLVITGSADRSVIIWNAQSGEMHRKIGVRDRVLRIPSSE
jgi:hypothetical protein